MSDLRPAPQIHHEYLANGVEVLLKSTPFAPAVAVQCWVRVGSLDERDDERGMAHFLEHMLFKGTERYAVGEIAATVEACGGDINAYTTFDRTVFHLTLAAEHAAIGVELLGDAIANSQLDPGEFEREREVILEEIKRSLDSPGARIGRRIFEIVFEGTEAGRPIIGSDKGVSEFSREALFAFYKRWYTARNLAVVVVGDFELGAMREQVKAAFGGIRDEASPQRSEFRWQPDAPRERPRCSVIKGDFQQPRLEIAFPAPPFKDVDSVALDLAAFALGAGELSRFNRKLRDEAGVVTSVGASVYSPNFGGVFELSAFTSLEAIPAAISGLAREISHFKHEEPITSDELARARANLRADRLYRDETVDGQARSLGFGLTTSEKLLYDDVYTALINHMPETAVAGAAERWMVPGRAVIVALVPETSTLTESDLERAWELGSVARSRRDASRKKRSAQGSAESPAAKIRELAPGIRLVYRRNPGAQLFTMTLATEGGLRAESQSDVGTHSALAGMLTLASRAHPFEEMVGLVEGMGASLEGFSGKDSLGFHFQCLNEQLDPMLGLLAESLVEPVFPEAQWVSMKREIEQAISSQNDSPANIAIRRFQEEIFGDHPYRFPVIGTSSSVAPLTAAKLLSRFDKTKLEGPWVIAAVGDASDEEAVGKLMSALKSFSPQSRQRKFDFSRTLPRKRASVFVEKEREQAHLVYGFPGVAWDDPDRPALDVLMTVLGGHGGRLFKELRDKESLAYAVSPLISYGTSGGIVGAYIACAPSKTAQALSGLKRELARVTTHEPSATEFERARQYVVGSHEIGLQRSDAQTSTMALMELYGYGFDDFVSYPKRVLRVTAADVKRVATRLFDESCAVDVTVGTR